MAGPSFLTEKTGGFPNWSLGAGAVLVLVAYKTWQGNKAAAAAAAAPAAGGTTPGATTAATASNYVQPGAGAIPYNTGAPTVFVVPGATTAAPPVIGRQPDNTAVPGGIAWQETPVNTPTQMGGGYYTTTGNKAVDQYVNTIPAKVYGIQPTDARLMALQAVRIQMMNPTVDFSHPLPAGTKLKIPVVSR